jgi:hypothetical protein
LLKLIAKFEEIFSLLTMRNLLLLFSVILSCSVFAQQKGMLLPKVQAGIRIGANYSNFRTLQNAANISDHKENTFLMAGAFAQVRIFKKFGLRAEILSNPKGALINYYDGNNISVEAIRKIQYADATISLMYNFRVLKFLGMYAFGGYSYESLTAAKDVIQKPYTSTQDISNRFSNNASSIIGGLGLRFHISHIYFSPEIRYLYGLTNISNGNGNTVAKNRVITPSLGIAMLL